MTSHFNLEDALKELCDYIGNCGWEIIFGDGRIMASVFYDDGITWQKSDIIGKSEEDSIHVFLSLAYQFVNSGDITLDKVKEIINQ